jgi:hypothetical protein
VTLVGLCLALAASCSNTTTPERNWVRHEDPILGLSFELPAEFVVLEGEAAEVLDRFRRAGAPELTMSFVESSMGASPQPVAGVVVALSTSPADWSYLDSITIATTGGAPSTPSEAPDRVLEAIRESLETQGATEVVVEAAQLPSSPALLIQYLDTSARLDGTALAVSTTLLTFVSGGSGVTVSLTTPDPDLQSALSIVSRVAESTGPA